MELINQKTKKIMEGCKERAKDAGLTFQDETLEYIVTNRDLLELSPKYMIPTLYDYWVHDVEVLKERGKYELYPSNPYETVINTRPAISFYNDNNPDWLNVMIFYHVLGHIDFFQNNLYFQHTWNYDFTGQALSDKRVIAKLRAEKGRWVDYVIEFTRGIDNIVGYFDELSKGDIRKKKKLTRIDFYFDIFVQSIKKIQILDYIKEIEKFNNFMKEHGETGEQAFFVEVNKKYPEFESLYKKSQKENQTQKHDLVQYIIDNSDFLKKDDNKWMIAVMEVVRKTSIFFQPQIRTKIMNEGWSSYWHEELFLKDDRIKGHEVDFARVNSAVTAMPRVGLNPYALGMQLFYYIKDLADRGKYTYDFQRLSNIDKRKKFDSNSKGGLDFIFNIRKYYSDFMFINTFVEQDFVTKNNLFVAGRRLNKDRMTWEYYVKSRKAKDYREMLFDSLYHPPSFTIDSNQKEDNVLCLNHKFEHKPLVQEFIQNTLMGIEYLWNGPVELETSEVASTTPQQGHGYFSNMLATNKDNESKPEIKWRRVLYTMKNRKLSKKAI